MDRSKNKGIEFVADMIPGMVSVIIPTHNREQTIKRSILSVLNQSYNNLEAIIVDDGSNDNTVNIIHSINDPRVRVIVLDSNNGACRARNIGVANSRGEWIAFQDSDDECFPEKLEKQLNFMKSGNYDFSFCQGYLILLNGNKIKSPKDSYGTNADRDWYHVLMTDFPVSTQKFLCRRYVLNVIGFDEDLSKSQDKDFALQVAHDFKVGFLAEPLVNIYATPQSITYSTKQEKRYYSVKRIVEKHLYEIDADTDAKVFFFSNLADNCYLFDRPKAIEYYKRSLRARLTGKVFVKLVLTLLGLRRFF